MIAEAIRYYLKECGITQASLSEMTGLTSRSIGYALMGKRKFSIEEYIKICKALEVPYDYFFILTKKEYLS